MLCIRVYNLSLALVSLAVFVPYPAPPVAGAEVADATGNVVATTGNLEDIFGSEDRSGRLSSQLKSLFRAARREAVPI